MTDDGMLSLMNACVGTTMYFTYMKLVGKLQNVYMEIFTTFYADGTSHVLIASLSTVLCRAWSVCTLGE